MLGYYKTIFNKKIFKQISFISGIRQTVQWLFYFINCKFLNFKNQTRNIKQNRMQTFKCPFKKGTRKLKMHKKRLY